MLCQTLDTQKIWSLYRIICGILSDVKDGAHTIGFGVPSHARTDLTSEAVGDKTWAYLDKETDAYL